MPLLIFGFELPLSWAIVIGASGIFLAYDYWCHTFWKRRGLPAVPALPLIANMLEFRKGIAESLLDFSRRFGRVYGLYDGRKPALVAGDPDLIKHIIVKNFSSFTNRRPLPLNNQDFDLSVVNLRDEHWRGVRNTIIPAFTASKMKLMSYYVNESADKMIKNIEANMEKNGCIECSAIFGHFVMDTVGGCAFGLDINSQANPDDPFVKHAKKAFDLNFFNPVFIMILICPWLEGLFSQLKFGIFPTDSMKFFRDVTLECVAMRRKQTTTVTAGSKKKGVDFLQLLLDAQNPENTDTADQEKGGDDDDNDVHNELDKQEGSTSSGGSRKKVTLTDGELVGQATTFFIAGYDTTKTLLTYTSYLLAMNTEVQEKLIREIDDLLPSPDEVHYNTVSKLAYLDQVVCESLRYYPPAALTDRLCTETVQYKDMTIPAGTAIFIPVIALHRDPELWPEPEKFDPERFSKEEREKRHPFSWLPFGGGPRICLGMRFALMEAKMALVRMLQVYRLETCPQTQIPPVMGKTGLIGPQNGITLRAVSRSDRGRFTL